MNPFTRSLLLIALSLASLFVGTQSAARAETSRVISTIDLQDGDTMVFLGDSITHQCLYTQYVEDFFRTRYPGRRINFHNAGVSGDRAADALARFDDDVAAFKPKYVSVLLGMNDGSYEDYNADTFAIYARGMTEILDRIEAIGAIPIVLAPTMFDQHQLTLQMSNPDYRFGNRDFAHNYNALLAYYAGWLREQADQRALPFVDLWTPLNDLTFQQRRNRADFTLIPDAIHPGAAGHFIMAFTLLNQLPPDKKGVDSIGITRNAKGVWQTGGTGEFSDLLVDEDNSRVSFTHTAASLPWVVPAEAATTDEKWDVEPPAALGYQLTVAGHKLSNERIRVFGLAPGNYQLSIDGKPIGKPLPHTRLAAKVELQSLADTPQYQQALAVAELNRERNDTTIRPMRGLWSQIKGLRRKLAASDPEKFAAEYAPRKAQIDELLKVAAQYDEKIYAAAQPKPRKYVVERIK